MSSADRMRKLRALKPTLDAFKERGADVRLMHVVRIDGHPVAYLDWDDETREVIKGKFPETEQDLPASFLGARRLGWESDKQWAQRIVALAKEKIRSTDD